MLNVTDGGLIYPSEHLVHDPRLTLLLDTQMKYNPAHTRHRPNVVPMLVQRRRRWTNFGTALDRCLMFAGDASFIDIHR